jgi:CRISPR-associated endonuclease Csy4
MNHYLDIQIRPDPEFTPQLLMSVLYGKLHRALVSGRQDDLGVSFPEHSRPRQKVGGVLRLHSDSGTLDKFMSGEWLSGMADHVVVSGIHKVPVDAQHRVVRRVQGKTNVERLRRRHAKRHDLSLEQAREVIPDAVESRIKLPFIMVRSQSTDRKFPLFIEHLPEQSSPVAGKFNSYGLSKSATVPWF